LVIEPLVKLQSNAADLFWNSWVKKTEGSLPWSKGMFEAVEVDIVKASVCL
jgi:hypothetical protein